MLRELQISNFAVIDQQEVQFTPGLNVITGQTGAGKSIVLQSIELILGGKATTNAIREGQKTLEVHAVFSLESLSDAERALLPDIVEGDEIVISRTLQRGGGGRCYLNGKLSTLSVLTSVTSHLVDLCGQSQYVKLSDPHFHLDVVDKYAEHWDLQKEYRSTYSEWLDLRARTTKARESVAQSELRMRDISFILEELHDVDLHEGRRAALESEVTSLANGEKTTLLLQEIEQTISAGNGISAQMGQLKRMVSQLEGSDPGAEQVVSLFRSAFVEIEEFESEFQRFSASFSIDEEKLEEKRSELAELARLERKYRKSDGELALFRAALQEEYDELTGGGNAEELEKRFKEVEIRLKKLADRLHTQRKKASDAICKKIVNELADLDMVHARMEFRMKDKPFSVNGTDDAEFFFTGNKGHSPKPLRSIASGGEMSRILLVMKNVISAKQGVNVLVFDEVDSGISGSVARAVGEKLRSLAALSQVICITHLPQVASLADSHLCVRKKFDAETFSEVSVLSDEERVEEVARMIAGFKITGAAKASARELIAGNS